MIPTSDVCRCAPRDSHGSTEAGIGVGARSFDRAEARHLHTRLLAYNEDDVRAQVAIRDGARERFGIH